MATSGKLVYAKYGDPTSVLSLVPGDPIPETLKANEAHVRVLYSPVNPSDLAVIPARPPLPATPGGEGVVEIVRGSSKFQPGDRAIVNKKQGWGYWQKEGVVEEDCLTKVPPELPIEAAATLIVNPCSAYIMLHKMVVLEKGDVVIQNAGNSALGTLIIQFAKIAGFRTINVIRNRPDLAETVNALKALGADAVITTDDLAKGLDKLNLGLPAPKLALECVGGHAGADLGKALANGGTMLVYGVMTGHKLHLAQTDLIFRDVTIKGFWMVRWISTHAPEEFGQVLGEVIKSFLTGQLQVPKIRKFPLEQWQDAIKAATKGFTSEKVLLQLN